MTARTLNRVVASAPIDKTARLVTQPGTHYEPQTLQRLNGRNHWSDAPPPSVPLSDAPNSENLLGVCFGRFVVVGYLGRGECRDSPAKWLVRCACGRWEARRARAIRNPENIKDACVVCRDLEYRKKDIRNEIIAQRLREKRGER